MKKTDSSKTIKEQEVHHCFECGEVADTSTETKLDYYTSSGLCEKCREKALAEMYDRLIEDKRAAALVRIAEAIESIALAIRDVGVK
jgi:recombinational DNA repair protein (RecF pathway)